jgi:branched-chain amino acid transport system substrate-binding protein
MTLRIGVFLPKSDMFPKLSIAFLNGIKLPFKSLASNQIMPQFVYEGIGNGSDDAVFNTIEKMLLQDEADVIVCFCSYFLLDRLTLIANTHQKPIFHVTLGARVLKKVHYSPYMIHQSLNLSHGCYLSGQLGVEKFGKRVAMLSSFYDGGYHMAEAFYNGLLDSGGEVVYNHVSPLDYQSETFETLIVKLQTIKPDFVFMIFSYNEAKKMLAVLHENGFDDLPAIAIPLMTNEGLLTHAIYPNNILTLASWAFDSNDTVMNDFKANYHTRYEENPDIMGLLGFEIGSMIANCIQNEGHLPNRIGDYFKNVTINSPRGVLILSAFNETVADFKLRKLENLNDTYRNSVIETINNYDTMPLYEKMAEVLDTGWNNPYICT